MAAVLGACALCLTVSACGGDDASNQPSGGTDHGPLAEFMGWTDGYSYRGPSEEERQQQYRVEELVAECMAEQGFEYIPQPLDERLRGPGEEYEEIWALQRNDPERFAREYGYGFSTMPDSWFVAKEDEGYEDPNWAIRESLSPAAQEEYDRALWGEWPELEEGEEVDGPIEPETPGCYAEASEEVYGSGDDFAQWEDINDQISDLYERIDNDPRVQSARQAWTDCMADAGHPGLEEVYDGQELVSDRMAELYGWASPEGEDFEAEDDGSVVVAPSATPSVDPAALAELQDFERAVAVADYQCRRDHYDPQYNAVRDELENQFIEEHRAELEAYRDFLNSRRPG